MAIDLLGAFEGCRLDIGAEILRHALPDEDEGEHDRDRQQDIQGRAGEIDPEIADGLGLAPREPTNERERKRDARRGREEIVDGETGHLGQIAHRRLAAVGLPVGVGDEAHRGVEGEALFDPGLPCRIEREQALKPLQRVERDKSDEAEDQQRDGIGEPMLLFLFIDAAAPVDRALERAQHRMQKGALAIEDARHVAAEWPGDGDDDHAEERDLDPAVQGHGILRSTRS